MTRSVRIPGSFDVPTRFFGQFTAANLVRITTPVLLVAVHLYPRPSLTAGTVALLVAGLTVGTGWYLWTPYDRHLDVHLRQAVRWVLGKRTLEDRHFHVKRDHVLVNDETVVGVIEVDPVSLEMMTDAEQGAVHGIYQQLFETVTYPVHVYSRQQELDLTDYLDTIAGRDAENEYLKESYLEYCRALTEEDLTVTRHFIVVRVEPDGLHDIRTRVDLPDWLPVDFDSDRDDSDRSELLRPELDSRCNEVVDALDSADVSAERLSGGELGRVIDAYTETAPDPDVTWTNQSSNPSGEFRKTAYVTEFPSSMELGWPTRLLRTEGTVDIVQVVSPRQASKTSKHLQRLSEKLNAEIESFLRQGYRGTNRLEGLLEDVEWMLDLLADRKDQPVDYAAYISASASDRDTCARTFEQVCNRLRTMQVDFEQPVFRTDQALYTDSPVYADRLNESMLMPAGSAAAGLPFATQRTDCDDGVIYGVDTEDGAPVLLDRFSWSSHSMARMGMVGSGKSYAGKLEILRARLAYPRLQVFVLDPKKEYKHLVRSLGGEMFTLDPDDDTEFDDFAPFSNPVVGFEVADRGQRENAEILVDAVEGLYNATSQNRNKTLVVIDETRVLMNHEEGRRVLNQFVLEGRDTNTAITLISQNASHFTYCREGREILDNMPGKVFMRHDRVPEDVVDYFDLSQREKQELYELKTGTDSPYSEALLKVSGRLDTRIRIDATDREHVVIDTEGSL